MKDLRIKLIEDQTTFDILNWDIFTFDAIDRCGSDEKIHTIKYYGKTISDIVEEINKL